MTGKVEIGSLVQNVEWPAISIYMPVSRIGDQQDPLRYKNFLNQVEIRLVEDGMKATEVRDLLAPEYELVTDSGFWKHLGADGLAVFRSAHTALRYPLPVSFAELVMVGKRFHVRPLIPLMCRGRHLVLALSRNLIQLYEGDRYQFREVGLPENTPKSMAEVLKYDDPERQLQFHTRTGTSVGDRSAMFHGQGVGIDDQGANLTRYLQAVDHALFPELDERKLPIVLGGTEEIQAAFRAITRGHAILGRGIRGNISEMRMEELQRKAWEIVDEHYLSIEEEAVGNYRENLGGDRAVDDPQQVLLAAFDGRVENLFVAKDEQLWGVFDTDKRQVMVKEQEGREVDNLLDEAVFWTLTQKGNVYIRERRDMPVDGVVCARLRF